jgi:hypothetical protein
MRGRGIAVSLEMSVKTEYLDRHLKPEVKKAWVQALRSGDYTQSTGRLRTEGGFCCLGVLCDLAVDAGIGKWNDELRFETPYESNPYDLPPAVSTWAGGKVSGRELTAEHVSAAVDGENILVADLLVGFNDDHKFTFNQIADLIEDQL